MSLVQTLTQSLRARYAPKTMDKNEIRPSRYNAMSFFQNQTDIPGGILSDPDLQTKLRNSVGNSVSTPVLNAENVTIGNTRSCTIAADSETSALVTFTWTTLSFGWTMTPARHFNNEIAYQQLFDRKLETYLLKMADTIDTMCVNKLNTDRNIYFPAAITKYYPQVGNALQVTQDQKDDYYNTLEAIMMEMDYYGLVNIIGSTSLLPMVKRLQAQGAGNSVNQSFQFDPYRWYITNRALNGAGVQSTMYAVTDGVVGMINRNMPDNMMNSKVGDHKVWGTASMPIVNMTMGTFYTQDCGDMTALDEGGERMSHLSRTKVEGFAFDTDICIATVYNSDRANRYNPIVKAEISAT